MTDETQPLRRPQPAAPHGTPPGATLGPLPETGRDRRRRYLRYAAYLAFALAVWPIVMTLVYAVVPPPISNVMVLRLLAGNGLDKTWVSLDQISPYLARAVVTSEDARFCEHHGVDWVEFGGVVSDAIDREGGPSRGASTIPMQTAKNLFLWDRRFGIRKLFEIPLAMWMDLVWSKRRMMEIYLNIVEWAPGVYGAEAAARHHFKKSAAQLSRKEAALLAAVLPNPIKRKAGKPSRGVAAIAKRIMIRMNGMGPYLACLDK